MSNTLQATIYHNPKCGTSRNTLRVLQDAGYQVEVVEYLTTGWQKAQLIALLEAAGLSAKQILRSNKTPAEELGLLAETVSDDEILNAMVEHPILVERPIVQTTKGTALCRPSEKVFALLTQFPPAPYFKEDGSMLLDEQGNVVHSK